MNDSERHLIRFVCDGDMRNAQKAVKIILNSISSKKDGQFKENMLRKLESKREFIELPYNLQHLLIAEDTEEFPEARFLLRNEEKNITQKIVAIYRASEKLNEIGIPYLPALMLYGQSGCGKTMLARYIAHKAKLPFLRIQFSNLVDSHLGQTQSNLARIFDYVRTAPAHRIRRCPGSAACSRSRRSAGRGSRSVCRTGRTVLPEIPPCWKQVCPVTNRRPVPTAEQAVAHSSAADAAAVPVASACWAGEWQAQLYPCRCKG